MSELRDTLGIAIFGKFWVAVKDSSEAGAVDRAVDAVIEEIPQISPERSSEFADGERWATEKIITILTAAKSTNPKEDE